MDFLKKIIGFAVGFAIVFSVIAFLKKDGKLPEFRTFQSDNGKFSILLPGKPELETREIFTENGNITLNFYLAGNKTSGFTAAYSILSDELLAKLDREKMLDGAVAGAVKNVNGTLISQSEFEDYGCKGREVLIKGNTLKIKGRIFLLDNMFYQLLIVGPENSNVFDKAGEFFKSFEYKKAI